jgi:gamma-glutamyltranspeptidase/glutathione hydrolase
MLTRCLPPCLIALLVLPVTVESAERPTGVPGKAGRSVTVASNGIVATSHPLAAQVGLDVLKQGGNAVDAAIATSAAMGLMEPMSCGVGGDLFAIVWDAKTQKLYGLNACGRAPGKASCDFFRGKGLKEIPTTGPLSWSVPGCVCGWDELRRKFGTKSFQELLAPSIGYAERGVPVPEVIGGYWRGAEARRDADFRAVYLQPGGKAPRVGEVFKNPALANTYRTIAEGGRDAYCKGGIARRLVAFSDRKGGLFALDDFAKHTSEWVEPVRTTYRGYDVWELPPPGQGIAALQMLNLLEPHDLRRSAPRRPTTGTCSSRRRSWPTRTGRSSTPTPRSPRCRCPNSSRRGTPRGAAS